MTAKIICVVHGPVERACPAVEGLRAYALHAPDAAEPPEHPPDVHAIAMAWLSDDAPAEPATWYPGARVDAYAADERVQIDYERDWPDGRPSPGIERISFLRRAAGLSRAEMATHWSERHFPLARVHHPALWRYVQNVVLEPLTPDAPEVDGIAQLHFRSVTDLRERFYDSDAGQRIIGEDVRRFLDPPAGWRMLAEETWLLRLPA